MLSLIFAVIHITRFITKPNRKESISIKVDEQILIHRKGMKIKSILYKSIKKMKIPDPKKTCFY